MKREADGDMGSPHKRTRRGDEEVRLLIPSKVAGSIIGKGGSNITKLRSQYKASITVPDCPGPERMLSLSSDLDTICNIVSDVVPNLEEHGGSNDLDLRMMIHQSQAGCVIGKAGYKIKELREKTGARVKIFSNTAPQSTDRVIQIQGDPDKCIDTIREIITLIKGSPVKGTVNPYDPHNYDDFYAEEYGGWGGNQNGGNDRRGGGGGSSRGGGGDFGGRGGRDNNRNDMRGSGPSRMSNNRGPPRSSGGSFNDRSSSGGRFGSSGGFGGRQSMNGSGFRSTDVWESPLSAPMNRGPSGGGLLGGGLQNGLGGGLGGGGKNSTQVTIPKDLAGAIIGKGGGRIRKIRQDSGAGITIDEPLSGSNDRIITITGSPNEIQMAQYLLQQSVHNNSQDRGNY